MKGNVLMFKINRDTIVFLSFIQRTHCAKCTGAKDKPSVYLAHVGWNRNCILLLPSPIFFMGLSGKICRVT